DRCHRGVAPAEELVSTRHVSCLRRCKERSGEHGETDAGDHHELAADNRQSASQSRTRFTETTEPRFNPHTSRATTDDHEGRRDRDDAPDEVDPAVYVNARDNEQQKGSYEDREGP